MGTLILTEPMEGHKQLIPLLLLSLGIRSAVGQNCWQCLGTGSDLTSCSTPNPNATQQVAIPAAAYETTGLVNICMTKVVFNVANCPTNGACSNSQATLLQVSRGLPELELEYQMYKTQNPTNATGTVCTSNGQLMTCTNLCQGDLCNGDIVLPELSSFTDETFTTKCILCQTTANSDSFEDCLMGTNDNNTQICAATTEGVGDTLLSGMCVTIVNYNNATLEPVTIYRGCGIPPESIFFPTGSIEYSTLGQCSESEINYNGNDMSTMSCVKGYVQDIETSEGSYIANYNRAAPGPMNATCLQCNAVIGDMQFASCMNPNSSTTADLAAMGVGESVCELGITECSTVFYYNGTEAGSTPVMVQRSCGEVQSTTSNTTDDCNADSWYIFSETCSASSVNGSLPCNSQVATPIPTISCYSCKAWGANSMSAFEDCLNPNGTSGLVEECGCGTNACMSATMYNANGTVIGVERGCGTAPGTVSQDVCTSMDPTDLDTSNVLCTSQCTASGTPCNDYTNKYTPGTTPVSSGIFISWSAVLLMISMLI